MKIFIVEDDYRLNKVITENLESLGYKVTTFTDGQEAFDNIGRNFDIYLIDINLPNINGLELVKQIKLVNIDAKVFIISGDTNIETIINAYDLGCDDYMKKPLDIREIVVKINHSLLRSSQVIKLCDNCTFSPINKLMYYKDSVIQLTNKETLLLDILIKNIGNTVSNAEIENYVWGETVGNGYIRQLVSKLRKSLPCLVIKNHAANGYRIEKYGND
ncbi:MAG: response regulator transcription factor [Arcobacteraceae bacterium]|nr:response regulator transcription factor [Arcobacteraceae bacterium]